MMNAVAKSGGLASYLKTSTNVSGTHVGPNLKNVLIKKKSPMDLPILLKTGQAMSVALPTTGSLQGLSGLFGMAPQICQLLFLIRNDSLDMAYIIRILFFILVKSQVRFAHTDIQIPDFTNYRRESTKDPNVKASQTDGSRKSFTYLIAGGLYCYCRQLATCHSSNKIIYFFAI